MIFLNEVPKRIEAICLEFVTKQVLTSSGQQGGPKNRDTVPVLVCPKFDSRASTRFNQNVENLGEQFLHQRDLKLYTSDFVEHEKERNKEEISQKPAEKIADRLEVIERIHTGYQDDDPQMLKRIKTPYHKESTRRRSAT